MDKHKKKLDEIGNRKAVATKSTADIEVIVRLNENKKQIHEIQQTSNFFILLFLHTVIK